MPFYGRQQLLAYNPNQQQMVTYPRRALENGNLPLDNQINESPSYLRNPDSFKPDIVNQIHQEFKLIYVWQITDYSYKEDYLFHLRDQKSCYVSSEVITNYGHKLCFVMEMNTFNDKTQSYWASIYAAFIRPREQYDQQVRYDIDFIVLNGNSEAVKRKARPPEQYLNGSLLSFVPGARRGGLWLGSEIGLWKNSLPVEMWTEHAAGINHFYELGSINPDQNILSIHIIMTAFYPKTLNKPKKEQRCSIM